MIKLPLAQLSTIVAVTVALVLVSRVQAGPITNFAELLAATNVLESAELLLTDQSDSAQQQKRNQLLYQFARAIKGDHARRHAKLIKSVADDFKKSALKYIEEHSKKRDWFAFLRTGPPMGAMRNLARYDLYLNTVCERYETQARANQLTAVDVDCDMNKFQMRNLHKIMFVLQTDIKYLVTENQHILNRAIYDSLKASNFVTNNNFHVVHLLSAKQKELLFRFYADRVDAKATKLEEALDHFHDVGEFIIGRLLDSCTAVGELEDPWLELEANHEAVCKDSKSDPKTVFFSKEFKFDKYIDTFKFCDEFLGALAVEQNDQA